LPFGFGKNEPSNCCVQTLSFLEVGVSIPFRLQGGQPSFQERVVMAAVRTDNLVMGK